MDLKKRARHLEPVLQVGKNGITEGTIAQLGLELKSKRLVKIKIRKSAADSGDHRQAIAEELASRSGAKIVETRGRTVVLHR